MMCLYKKDLLGNIIETLDTSGNTMVKYGRTSTDRGRFESSPVSHDNGAFICLIKNSKILVFLKESVYNVIE